MSLNVDITDEVNRAAAAELRRMADEIDRLGAGDGHEEAPRRGTDWLRKRAFDLDGREQPEHVIPQGGPIRPAGGAA